MSTALSTTVLVLLLIVRCWLVGWSGCLPVCLFLLASVVFHFTYLFSHATTAQAHAGWGIRDVTVCSSLTFNSINQPLDVVGERNDAPKKETKETGGVFYATSIKHAKRDDRGTQKACFLMLLFYLFLFWSCNLFFFLAVTVLCYCHRESRFVVGWFGDDCSLTNYWPLNEGICMCDR